MAGKVCLSKGVLPLIYEKGRLLLVDQRKLPEELTYFDATSLDDMMFAIKDMVVRGAPSIGVAAGYALCLYAVSLSSSETSKERFLQDLALAKEKLDETRPTAVNLKWATEKILKQIEAHLKESGTQSLYELKGPLEKMADQLLQEHIDLNERLSEFGSELVGKDYNILTHCNAGSLAACGWGTALGVIRSAHLKGLNPRVFVDETRPRNQGARLTMWELAQDNIDATLICDSMSGTLMSQGKVNMVVVGADRIAANGDTANKIGTYNLAIIAHYHNVPFYVAAPISTIDGSIQSGEEIPIEERPKAEVSKFLGMRNTIENAQVFNPAFDVTPNRLITGIVTEKGVLLPDFRQSIKEALSVQSL